MLAAVADEEQADVAELRLALRAATRAGVDLGGLGHLSRLPVRALDRPGDCVLQPAEGRAPLADRLIEPEAVVDVHPGAAPAAAFGHQPIG